MMDKYGVDLPFWRLPKPHELGLMFASLPERIWDWQRKDDPEQVKQWLLEVVKALPIARAMPTAATPVIEHIANYSFFFHQPIVPKGKEKLPAELQFGPTTSASARILGKWLHMSPAILENYIGGYFGGLGRQTSRGYGLVALAQERAPAPHPSDIPGIRAFFSRVPGGSTTDIDRFYSKKERIDRVYHGVKELQRLGQFDAAAERMERNAELLMWRPLYEKAAEIMNKLRKQVYELQDIAYSGPLTPRQRRLQIDELRRILNDVAESVNEMRSDKKAKARPDIQKILEETGS